MTEKKILEEIREWIADDAPGQDRVRDLSPPPLPARPPAPRKRSWLFPYGNRFALQGAVACALFAFGYFLGSSGTQPQRWAENPFSAQEVGDSYPPRERILGDGGTRKDSRSSGTVQTAPKEKPKPQAPQTYTREEDGRLVIETTLKDSGARALWVVDGRFELAKSDW